MKLYIAHYAIAADETIYWLLGHQMAINSLLLKTAWRDISYRSITVYIQYKFHKILFILY